MTMSCTAFQPVSVASHTRTQRPRAARRQITCSAIRDVNVPALGLGALAAAQLALGAPAFAEINFDTSKLGGPAQNKDATDLPSTFFKAGDSLQSKLGLNTDNLNKDLDSSNSGGAANAPNLRANQKDFQIDSAIQDISKAGKKAADNITPDLSELPSPQQLADKAKGAANSAGAKLPDPSQAVDKAKGLGSDVGSNVGSDSAGDVGKKVPDAGKASLKTPDGLGSKNL